MFYFSIFGFVGLGVLVFKELLRELMIFYLFEVEIVIMLLWVFYVNELIDNESFIGWVDYFSLFRECRVLVLYSEGNI